MGNEWRLVGVFATTALGIIALSVFVGVFQVITIAERLTEIAVCLCGAGAGG